MNIDKDLNYETPQLPSIIEGNDSSDHISNLSNTDFISSAFHRGPSRRTGYKLTGFLLASVVADMLVITACTFLFLMGASAFLKMNGNSLLQTGFYLYGYISIIYFILLRIFLGATIGEWSCGIRIGQPFERMQSSYALKICSRVFLILATGIITLPLLSLIFKKDLAGKLTQASLYTLK